MNAIFWKETFT